MPDCQKLWDEYAEAEAARKADPFNDEKKEASDKAYKAWFVPCSIEAEEARQAKK